MDFDAEMENLLYKMTYFEKFKESLSWNDMPEGFQNPHCDFSIVHAPGRCQICDEIAFGLQALRVVNHVNFTGVHEPDKAPCPSEIFRHVVVVETWMGNAPDGPATEKENSKETSLRQEGWLNALEGFQRFYSNDRELQWLKTESETLAEKIARLEQKMRYDPPPQEKPVKDKE